MFLVIYSPINPWAQNLIYTYMYIAQSEINTYKTSCNRAMTLSFSLRITNLQITHAAFPFFLVRHLYARASRPQHLSSAIFCSVRTDCRSRDRSAGRSRADRSAIKRNRLCSTSGAFYSIFARFSLVRPPQSY